MKTQENVDVRYSREWNCRAMAVPAPDKHEAAHYNRGFTLVELLMVIAIIGVLCLMVLPQFSHLQNLAKEARAKSEIRTVEKSIIAYNLDNGNFPPNLAAATTTTTDPWGNPYQYNNIQTNPGGAYVDQYGNPMNNDFDLYSKGINGLSSANLTDPNCLDDIIRAADGSILELGSDF